jgi:uncharacterized protein YraI
VVVSVLSSTPAEAQRRTLCVHGLEAGQSLPVYGGPSAKDPQTGAFPAATCDIRLAGTCSGNWCPMAAGDVRGWVDTRFIGVYEVPGEPRAEAPPSRTAQRPAPRPVRVARAAPRPVEQGSAEPRACVARVAYWDTLRIRSGPGVGHEEIGEIPPRACGVAVTGGCRGPWCRIAWRGTRGWVHTHYLD